MALKSIEQVPSLAERLTNVRLERFDPAGAAFQNCVVSGLYPQTALNPSLSNTVFQSGQAIVGGVLFDVTGTTPTMTGTSWNYFWVDEAGVLQIGAAWPGTTHARVCAIYCNASMPVRIYRDPDNCNLVLGYDPAKTMLVAPGAAAPGTRGDLYEKNSTVSTETGVKFCQHGFFAWCPVVDEIKFYAGACNVSGTDKCITARAGFMESDETTWVEGAYQDLALTNGAGVKYFTFDEPWVPDPQHEYVLCVELTEYGASFIASDFSCKGSSQNISYPAPWLIDRYYGGAHIRSLAGAWAWESIFPYWSIRGYAGQGAYAQITAEELAEAPATFQTCINMRSVDAGVYQAIDPDTQLVVAEVSLDGGAHWTALSPGEDLSTVDTGTDLIYRVKVGDNNADDIEVDSLGFSYEV